MSNAFGVYVEAPYTEKRITCYNENDCKQKSPFIEYGKIYTVKAKLKEPVDPSATARIVNIISEIRKKYPGISINYLEISDDRKTVTIQLFDPPATTVRSQAIPAVVYVVISIIALLLVAKYTGVIDMMYMIVSAFVGKKPEPPPPGAGLGEKAEYFMDMLVYYAKQLAIPAALIGFTTFMIYKIVKKK